MAIDSDKTIKQATTSAGNTYRMFEDKNGNTQFHKNGQFTSAQSFRAGYGEATKGNGTIEASDGRYMPWAEVEVETPDGSKRMRHDKAREVGKAANSDSDGTVEIDGVEYDNTDIRGAFRDADERGRSPVRY